MVKGALIKNIFREIKSSLGRYFAILLIIALGVGFFAGLRLCEPFMRESAVRYLDEYSFFDFRLLSTLGFTEDDVAAFSAEDGIIAEGAYLSDFLAVSDGGETVFRAHSISENINLLKIKSGRLPENGGECVIDSRYYGEDIIGSYIEVSPENSEDTVNGFSNTKYLVVGTVSSPYYLNYERGTSSVGTGRVSAFVYIPKDGFSSDAFHEIYLKFENSEKAYGDEYDKLADSFKDRLEELLEKRGDIRYEEIRTEAEISLADGKKELEDNIRQYEEEKAEAEKKLSESLSELRSSEEKINSAKAEISERKKELSDGEKAVSDGFSAIEQSEKELAAKKEETYNTLSENEKALSESKESIEQAIIYYDSVGDFDSVSELTAELAKVEAGLEAVAENRRDADFSFAAAQSEIEKNREELVSKRTEIENGKSSVETAEREISENEKKLSDGYSEYYSAKEEADGKFAEALEKINEAKAEIEDAETEISKLEKPSLYLLDRNTNIGYVCFDNDSSIVKSISMIFPLFFLLVAILVCMTTMTRMVDECRGQIGTLKALGYKNSAIQSKFLIYSGSAAVAGWLIGYFAGTVFIPKLIWAVYGIMYNFSDIVYVFDLPMFLICLAAALLCSCGASYAACRSELRPLPSSLLRPKSPRAGKKIFLEYIPFIWKKLGFLKKVSVRNIFRYKNRLFMMILGIGGSTALLLTGFGIRDSIHDVVAFQFDEIMTYDISVTLSSDDYVKISEDIVNIDGVSEILKVSESSDDLIFGANSKSVNLIISENNNFDGFVSFGKDGKAIPVPNKNEVLLSTGAAEDVGAKVGDTVILRDSDFKEAEFTVSGIFDNYIYNYAVISPDGMKDGFGSGFSANAVYVKTDRNFEVGDVSVKISNLDGISNLTVNEDLIDRIGSTMNSVNYIVLLVLVCAGALAFIVIYNLTNINIEERVREIATIKVLGFRKREVSSYVMREIIILTAIGALVGLPLGKLLHSFVMSCINVDMVTFQNKITPLSYLFALVLTFVFAFIINIFMTKRLDKIDMAASLKSVE